MPPRLPTCGALPVFTNPEAFQLTASSSGIISSRLRRNLAVLMRAQSPPSSKLDTMKVPSAETTTIREGSLPKAQMDRPSIPRTCKWGEKGEELLCEWERKVRCGKEGRRNRKWIDY